MHAPSIRAEHSAIEPHMRIQFDKCWSFVYAKLMPSFMMGNPDFQGARMFVDDLATRLKSRTYLTTDGLRV